MASRALEQEQFLSSLRHTLFDLARRLQQDTVGGDVADYVLFRLEQVSRHLVRLADNMQVFDTVRDNKGDRPARLPDTCNSQLELSSHEYIF